VLPIQNAEASQAVAAGLGLKGKVSLKFDEIILGMILTADNVHSPYSTDPLPIASGRQAALAVNNSAVGITPGAGLILKVDQITVVASSGNALSWRVHILGPVTLAAVTTVASPNAANRNSLLGGSVNAPETGSRLLRITNATLTGLLVHRSFSPASEARTWDIPDGYYLYGDDPAGASALVVWNPTQNEEIVVNFVGREFRNKG